MATAFENRVLELTNAYRAQNGLPALTMNETLVKSAQKHSANMATIATDFSHTDSRGWEDEQRNKAEGYTGRSVAENIAASSRSLDTPERVVQSWINSTKGHRENLLNPDATEMGVGHYQEQVDADGDGMRSYTTQVFGVGNGVRPNPNPNVPGGTGGNDVQPIIGRDLSYVRETLTGTNQADTLVGLSGQDILTGGGGADRFVFTEKDIDGRYGDGGRTLWPVDVINDFNPLEGDRIVLVGNKFHTSDISQRLSFDSNTGTLSVDGKAFVQLAGTSTIPSGNTLPSGFTAASLASLGVQLP